MNSRTRHPAVRFYTDHRIKQSHIKESNRFLKALTKPFKDQHGSRLRRVAYNSHLNDLENMVRGKGGDALRLDNKTIGPYSQRWYGEALGDYHRLTGKVPPAHTAEPEYGQLESLANRYLQRNNRNPLSGDQARQFRREAREKYRHLFDGDR